MRPGSPEHRARIIADIRRWCAGIRQYFADIDHWNRTHPNEPPLGDESEDALLRQMVAEAEEMLAGDLGYGPLAPFTYAIGREPNNPQ
jgi:hypothetical protein